MIYVTPFRNSDKQTTGPSTDAGFASLDDVVAAMGGGYGVGFLFTPNDPFFFVDLDKCLSADNTTWSPVAMDIINRLPCARLLR